MSLSPSQKRLFNQVANSSNQIASERLLKAVGKISGVTVSKQEGNNHLHDVIYQAKEGITYQFVLSGKGDGNGRRPDNKQLAGGSDVKAAVGAMLRDHG